MRYRAGQGVEAMNQFLEIAKANNLWGFYSYTFTLPQGAKTFIDINSAKAKDFLLDVRRAVSKTIKGLLGLNSKARNIQPGFQVMYHPTSSGNPFKQSSHFHTLTLPMLADLKNNKIIKSKKRLDHKKVKAEYKKQLDKVLIKYGLDESIEDKYVVHLYDVELAHETGVIHAFKYQNRSMVQDLFRSIKKMDIDFENFVCLLIDKKNDVGIPVLKNKTQILDALEFILNPYIQVRMAYGFMRSINKYSELLGVALDEHELNENWETKFYIELFRVMRNRYDPKLKKVRPIITIYWKRRDGPDESYQELTERLGGEKAAMSDRKLYKAIR